MIALSRHQTVEFVSKHPVWDQQNADAPPFDPEYRRRGREPDGVRRQPDKPGKQNSAVKSFLLVLVLVLVLVLALLCCCCCCCCCFFFLGFCGYFG